MHFRLTFNHPGPRHAIGCVAALYRRDRLMDCLPDEYFTGAAEDRDLCRRLRERRHKLAVAHAHILHAHRSDFSGFVRQRLWYGRGNGRLAWRHQTPWLLADPLAFLIGGSLIALRAARPQLIPYIVLHFLLVTLGQSIEYCELAWKSSVRHLTRSPRAW
jgi:GT2 family glycosyltransferase